MDVEVTSEHIINKAMRDCMNFLGMTAFVLMVTKEYPNKQERSKYIDSALNYHKSISYDEFFELYDITKEEVDFIMETVIERMRNLIFIDGKPPERQSQFRKN